MKLCELPCPKCGSEHVNVTYYPLGFLEIGGDKPSTYFDPFPSDVQTVWKCSDSHLVHHCTVCGFRFESVSEEG